MISVLVCTYNRCEALGRALQSLAQMKVPAALPWEVIVVDNNSGDQTREVVASFARIASFPVIYVFESEQGLSHARNAGIKRASGDIISFLDDDVIVDSEWLASVKQAFDRFDPACVGGRVLIADDIQRPRWWNAEFDAVLGKCDLGCQVLVDDPRNQWMIGANISFRRRVLRELEFSTAFGRVGNNLATGEDTEILKRLIANGERLVYSPACLVYHAPHRKRLTRDYVRRWYYRVGEFRTLAAASVRTNIPTLFGAPRWLYRSIAVALISAVGKRILRQHEEAMRTESGLWLQLGEAAAERTMRRRGQSRPELGKLHHV